jgi:hypothetical protein
MLLQTISFLTIQAYYEFQKLPFYSFSIENIIYILITSNLLMLVIIVHMNINQNKKIEQQQRHIYKLEHGMNRLVKAINERNSSDKFIKEQINQKYCDLNLRVRLIYNMMKK